VFVRACVCVCVRATCVCVCERDEGGEGYRGTVGCVCVRAYVRRACVCVRGTKAVKDIGGIKW